MKNIKAFLSILFINFIFLHLHAQEIYQWDSIQKISYYDLTNHPTYKIESAKTIPKNIKFISCKISAWNEILSNITTEGSDVGGPESHLVVVVKFKNGESIPFKFLPKQKVLMDLRKEHFIVLFFKKEVFEKVDQIYKSCATCFKDPNCQEIK